MIRDDARRHTRPASDFESGKIIRSGKAPDWRYSIAVRDAWRPVDLPAVFQTACRNGDDGFVRDHMWLMEEDMVKQGLLQAVKGGKFNILKLWLQQPGTDVNEIMEGVTLLYTACKNGRTSIASSLLAHTDIDVNKATSSGDTPLCAACRSNHGHIVGRLLAHPSIAVNKTKRNSTMTALCIANKSGYSDIVERLLAHPDIDVNRAMVVNDGRGFMDMTDPRFPVLVSPTAETFGLTPLFLACRAGHDDVVDLLLKQPGIDINKAGSKSGSPLTAACRGSHWGIVGRLLERRDDIYILRSEDIEALAQICIHHPLSCNSVFARRLCALPGISTEVGPDEHSRTLIGYTHEEVYYTLQRHALAPRKLLLATWSSHRARVRGRRRMETETKPASWQLAVVQGLPRAAIAELMAQNNICIWCR